MYQGYGDIHVIEKFRALELKHLVIQMTTQEELHRSLFNVKIEQRAPVVMNQKLRSL